MTYLIGSRVFSKARKNATRHSPEEIQFRPRTRRRHQNEHLDVLILAKRRQERQFDLMTYAKRVPAGTLGFGRM
jgi:hypothetical protein